MKNLHLRSSRSFLTCGLARGVGLALALSMGAPAWASDAQQLRTRALAATCAQCHGTDGRAVAGEPMVALAGQQKDHLLTQLMAFRSGQRKATIMHQITRGYSAEQLEALSVYFAAQK